MTMSKSNNVAGAVDKLVLDIKALVLLSDSKESLHKVVEDKLLSSHDEDISNFVSIVRSRQKATQLGYFLMALGELLFAAFLVIGGLAIIAPSLLGLSSPSALISYYGAIILDISSSGLSSPVIAFINFLFAIALLLAGFYSLRVASTNLKETGVLSESSG